MITILSGVAKVGKSLIVKELREITKLNSFSTDYLMMALANNRSVTTVDPEENDWIVAKKLEPYLHGMIRAMAQNGVDMIFEGVHFTPGFVRELMTEFPGNVRAVFLGFSEVDTSKKIEELRSHMSEMENPWFEYFSEKQMILVVDDLKKVSLHTKHECEKYDIPYVDVHNVLNQKDEIISLLLGHSY